MADSANQTTKLLDPGKGLELRQFLESLRGQMVGVRGSWDPIYGQLKAFFAPYSAQFDADDTNDGSRQDQLIINETGALDLDVLTSGMHIGMSDQTRDWFKSQPENDALRDNQEVKQWCEDVDDVVRRTMLKSNFYETLLEMYESEGLYGTGVFIIEEDDETDINCKSYPVGSYYLGCDDQLRVDLMVRVLRMTARQIVEKFGYDNVSSATQTYYDSNAGGTKETYYDVVHVIHKGTYYSETQGRKNPPWMSIWYELSSFNQKTGVLRIAGFHECPMIVGRWKTRGEDIYGRSPAMKVLGSVMSLQAYEERLAQASEKQFNPTLLYGSSVDPRKLTSLPGDFLMVNDKDVTKAVAPAYNVDFKLDAGLKMLERIESRIHEGMFRSTFQRVSDLQKSNITAEEIRAIRQEQMQVVGPVIERNVGEVHAPSYRRIVSILFRRGRLPPMPAAMKRKDGGMESISVVFESILASAQKMAHLNNLNTVVQFAGQEAALDQGLLDNIDMDATFREYAADANVPAKLIRTAEQVAAIRADKARAQQQQMMAANAKDLAQAAQTASQTPAGAGTLLQRVAPGLVGGQPP